MSNGIRVINFPQFEKDMRKVAKSVRGEIAEKSLSAGAHTLEAEIKLNIAARGLVDTGNLINSVQVYDLTNSKNRIWCFVGSRGVVYAKIHEFGGTILPKRAKMLHWIDKDTGADVFAHRAVIPARPYLRPAVDEKKHKIEKAFVETMRRLLEELKR